MRFVLAALLVTVFASPALAEEPEPEVRYRRRTVIELDPHVVEGTTQGPGGTIVTVRNGSHFPVLLRIRESFRTELLQSGLSL